MSPRRIGRPLGSTLSAKGVVGGQYTGNLSVVIWNTQALFTTDPDKHRIRVVKIDALMKRMILVVGLKHTVPWIDVMLVATPMDARRGGRLVRRLRLRVLALPCGVNF